MANTIKRVLSLIDPLTGLPRAIVDTPVPEELVDEHFVYKSSAQDMSNGLIIDDTKFFIDVDDDE